MSSTEPLTDPGATVGPADTLDRAEWLRANWVTVAAVLALVLQLWWRSWTLAQSFFQQNDYPLLYRATASKFRLSYLLTPANGQLAPGGRAVIWLEARAGLYNWGIASAITLVMLALAGLALLHLLRRLFGNRPAILAPYALYLVTPLVLPSLTWWSATLAWLPLQIASFMAMSAHVCYVRTGRFRHAAAAACWMAAGVLFLDKGVLSPLLLLALTSAFLLPGRWTANLLAALRRYWLGWLLYAGVMAAYVLLAVLQVSKSGFTPRPMAAGPALSFASSLLRAGLVPSLVGGPWRWWSTGSYAVAAQAPLLTSLSWLATAVAVLTSSFFSKRAWRAWLVLAAWVAIADIVPAQLGLLGTVVAPSGTADLSYLADAAPVIVVCAALAFCPVLGEASPYRSWRPSGPTWTVIAFSAAGVVVVSSLWSAQAYEKATAHEAARSYVATARVALRQVPAHTEIVSAPVPTAVMSRALFGDASNTSAVLGPLVPRSAPVRWTTSPQGAVHRLMIFDEEGRLWPAIVSGVPTLVPAGPGTCWRLGAGDVRVSLQHALYRWPWFAEFGYSGPATTLGLKFSGSWHLVGLAAGRQNALAQVPGAGSSVTIRNLGPAQPGCLTYLAVGTLQPSPYGSPQPAKPVSS